MKAHLRYVGGGFDKTWTVESDAGRIVIRYGRTGKVLRSHVVPASRFAGRTPEQEARRRMRAKLDGGYEVVRQSRSTGPGPDPSTRPWPVLYVTVRDRDRDEVISRLDEAYERARQVAGDLGEGLCLRIRDGHELRAESHTALDATYALALAHRCVDVVTVADDAGVVVDPVAFFRAHEALHRDDAARRMAQELGLLRWPVPRARNVPVWFY